MKPITTGDSEKPMIDVNKAYEAWRNLVALDDPSSAPAYEFIEGARWGYQAAQEEIEMNVISGHEAAIKELMDKSIQLNEALKLAVEALEKCAHDFIPAHQRDTALALQETKDFAEETIQKVTNKTAQDEGMG